MRKNIKYIILAIIIVVVSYRLYSDHIDNQLVINTNMQLHSLFEPVVNNTVFIIEGDKYLLRINSVKLANHIEPYKEALKYNATLSFNIYKNNIDSQSKIGEGFIENEVWRSDLGSNFNMRSMTRYMGELTARAMLYGKFFDAYYNHVYNELYPLHFDRGVTTGKYKFDEDAVDFDFQGNLERTGNVYYKTTLHNEVLSISFESTFEMKEYSEPVEILINQNIISGNYHPLWDLKAENIKEISFSASGSVPDTLIVRKQSIKEIVDYVKVVNFEKYDTGALHKSIDKTIRFGDDYFNYLHISYEGQPTLFVENYVCKDPAVIEKLISILEKSAKAE